MRTYVQSLFVSASDGLNKASSLFGRLQDVWRNKHISLKVKVRLYESLVMSTMLYSVRTGASDYPTKEKAGCRTSQLFQRRLLGITWKDKVRNEDIRSQTKLQKMDLIIKERRLRCLGHVLRISRRQDTKTIRTMANGLVHQKKSRKAETKLD